MGKSEMEKLDKKQVQEVVNALEKAVDSFKELLKGPQGSDFAMYSPTEGMQIIGNRRLEEIIEMHFIAPCLVTMDDSNLAFWFDKDDSFVIGEEDYIHGPMIWGKVVGESFIALDVEDYPDVANQMFLRRAHATIEGSDFILYRFLNGDSVTEKYSLCLKHGQSSVEKVENKIALAQRLGATVSILEAIRKAEENC